MDPWVMWLVAGAFVLAPLLLMVLFNGGDTADARGRRHRARWHS